MTKSVDPSHLGGALFSTRGVDATRASPQQRAAAHVAAQIAQTTLDLTSHHIESLQGDPTWGLVFAALGRVQEYTEGCIATSLVSPVAAEIIARTVVEGSINVRYIVAGDIPARVYAYFNHYLQSETDQNTKWSHIVGSLPDGEEAQQNRAGLDQKSRALEIQKQVVTAFFTEIGVNPEVPEKWGTTFDRFNNLGEALEYRTIYAALCSQTHNDAEDLLNSFTIHATGNEDRSDALRAETAAFSWFAVTLGLRQYARAASDYWKKYTMLNSQPDLIATVIKSADELAYDAASRVRGK